MDVEHDVEMVETLDDDEVEVVDDSANDLGEEEENGENYDNVMEDEGIEAGDDEGAEYVEATSTTEDPADEGDKDVDQEAAAAGNEEAEEEKEQSTSNVDITEDQKMDTKEKNEEDDKAWDILGFRGEGKPESIEALNDKLRLMYKKDISTARLMLEKMKTVHVYGLSSLDLRRENSIFYYFNNPKVVWSSFAYFRTDEGRNSGVLHICYRSMEDCMQYAKWIRKFGVALRDGKHRKLVVETFYGDYEKKEDDKRQKEKDKEEAKRAEKRRLEELAREEAERKADLDARTLYVKDLFADATKEMLKEIFSSALNINMPLDKGTGKCKGHAYLEFVSKEAATEALEKNQKATIGEGDDAKEITVKRLPPPAPVTKKSEPVKASPRAEGASTRGRPDAKRGSFRGRDSDYRRGGGRGSFRGSARDKAYMKTNVDSRGQRPRPARFEDNRRDSRFVRDRDYRSFPRGGGVGGSASYTPRRTLNPSLNPTQSAFQQRQMVLNSSMPQAYGTSSYNQYGGGSSYGQRSFGTSSSSSMSSSYGSSNPNYNPQSYNPSYGSPGMSTSSDGGYGLMMNQGGYKSNTSGLGGGGTYPTNYYSSSSNRW